MARRRRMKSMGGRKTARRSGIVTPIVSSMGGGRKGRRGRGYR